MRRVVVELTCTRQRSANLSNKIVVLYFQLSQGMDSRFLRWGDSYDSLDIISWESLHWRLYSRVHTRLPKMLILRLESALELNLPKWKTYPRIRRSLATCNPVNVGQQCPQTWLRTPTVKYTWTCFSITKWVSPEPGFTDLLNAYEKTPI